MKDHNSTDDELIRFRAEAERTLGVDSEAEVSEGDHPPEREKSPSDSPQEVKTSERHEEP
jgi:hypothetical protein